MTSGYDPEKRPATESDPASEAEGSGGTGDGARAGTLSTSSTSASPSTPVDHSHDIYTVANIITIARLVLIPFFFSALLRGGDRSDLFAFILFATAALTDWVDGQIARRTNTVTAIGKVLDPIVDRALIASGVIGLYIIDRIPLWMVAVLILRDVYLLSGSYRLEHHHLRIPVTKLGKWTTAFLLTGFASLIWNHPVVDVGVGEPATLGIYFVYVGLVMSLGAAVQYTVLARRALAEVGRQT